MTVIFKLKKHIVNVGHYPNESNKHSWVVSATKNSREVFCFTRDTFAEAMAELNIRLIPEIQEFEFLQQGADVLG